MKDWLTSTFPWYTAEMWEGNEPEGEGYNMVDGGKSERWKTKYGGGETYKEQILCAEFNINQEITIFITDDCLWIMDNRYSGKSDFWEYVNIEGHGFPGFPCCTENHRHRLEPEKIEKILNTKIDNCKFWDMVQQRAKELYLNGIIPKDGNGVRDGFD